MHAHRLLTFGPDHEPLWVRLYVQPIGERWAAAILAGGAPPPELGSFRGMAFVGKTPEDAQRLAVEHLGQCVSQNCESIPCEERERRGVHMEWGIGRWRSITRSRSRRRVFS